MATFKSKYAELTFYVDGKPRSFRDGVYKTEDKAEIEVIEKLADVICVEESQKPTAKRATTAKK